MPNFRFHIINDIDAPDDEGLELDNLAAAHLKAIDYARDLASASVRQGRLDLKHRIDVEGDEGNVLVPRDNQDESPASIKMRIGCWGAGAERRA